MDQPPLPTKNTDKPWHSKEVSRYHCLGTRFGDQRAECQRRKGTLIVVAGREKKEMRGGSWAGYTYMTICWVVPPPSKSHHQDYEPFLVGNPELNLHFHYDWEGGQPKRYDMHTYSSFYCMPDWAIRDLL